MIVFSKTKNKPKQALYHKKEKNWWRMGIAINVGNRNTNRGLVG